MWFFFKILLLGQTFYSSFWIYNDRLEELICLMFVTLGFISSLDNLLKRRLDCKTICKIKSVKKINGQKDNVKVHVQCCLLDVTHMLILVIYLIPLIT